MKEVNFKEEGGGDGRATQIERAGRIRVQQQQVEERAAVNHRVSTGSVSTSRREGFSTICLINSKLNPGLFL